MIRTFIDAGVLIAAARSASVGLDKAFDVFKDQNYQVRKIFVGFGLKLYAN